MTNKCKLILDVELGEELFECPIVKLLIIISDNGVEKSKLADDGFPKETFDLAPYNISQGFCLYPISKIVNGDNEKLLLSSC